jgi:pimeloyl-ACP methyl ester carboxylesterase
MPFAEIDGTEVYYDIQGFGECIFLMHHGFGCSKMWDKIASSLVEQGFKTVCYDRRGYGQTARGMFPYDFYVSERFREESIADLEHLRHWLGIDSFHVISHCEGGVVAADYAAAYPERVKTVVISSTMCYSTMPLWQFNSQKFTKSFDQIAPGTRAKFLDWHGANTEEFFEQFRKFGGSYGKEMFDLRPVLNKISCPTLILYPDRSFLFEVEQGVAFYRNLLHGELAVLPNCGHNTYEEKPQEFLSHAVDFLNRHRYGDLKDLQDKSSKPVTCAG